MSTESEEYERANSRRNKYLSEFNIVTQICHFYLNKFDIQVELEASSVTLLKGRADERLQMPDKSQM